MKSYIFKNLIQEILSEMFLKSLNLNDTQEGSKIVIIFQDNKIELQKFKDKFKVLQSSNGERIKPEDIIEFVDSNISIGSSPKCSIYRKNKVGKFMKTNFVHEFSSIKGIEVI